MDRSASENRTERSRAAALLSLGAAAGPLYLAAAAVQALARDGVDPSRHAVSLLANGAYGWVQIATFVAAEALVLLAAAGMRGVLSGGPGRRWLPRLVALYGAGLIAAGVFVADPAYGFPPGTPEGAPETVSWLGALHFAASGIAFVALVGACLLFARRWAVLGGRGWAGYSLATGCLFLAAWIALVATAAENRPVHLAFTIAVAGGWIWLSAVAIKLARAAGTPEGQSR